MYNEKTSRQRVNARISTSTKLPGTDRVTPPLVTPLVDNGAALDRRSLKQHSGQFRRTK